MEKDCEGTMRKNLVVNCSGHIHLVGLAVLAVILWFIWNSYESRRELTLIKEELGQLKSQVELLDMKVAVLTSERR